MIKEKNKKITLIILDENNTKTLNIRHSFFNLIKPFLFFSSFSVSILGLFLLIGIAFFVWNYTSFNRNIHYYSVMKYKLMNSYKGKEKELEIAKSKVLAHEKEIIESKKDLQKLKSYLYERGVHIKPTYKGNLGKIRSNKQNVGGPLNLNKSHIKINKNINNEHVDINEIRSMYDAIKKIPTGYPYVGTITSLFGYRLNPISNTGKEFHRGLDIKGNYGDKVKVTADGVVSFAGSNGGYGNVIKVKNGFGYSTFYSHLSKINVKKGQGVKAGNIIGEMGSTGRSTGVHLHYEVRRHDEPIDPELFLTISD